MAGSVHTEAYRNLLKALVALRNERGYSQADLATRLRKPPSYVGKYEIGERRLDVIELAVILRALQIELPEFWTLIALSLPETL